MPNSVFEVGFPCLINHLPQNQNVERFHLFHTEKITEK